jgi:AcrR family transcriptional regulator
MHGAMIEAVAHNGYERTSVKQVVGLAGVSRRSFYEQFANKQECFLATYDLIATRSAGRVSAAYRATRGDAEERMLPAPVIRGIAGGLHAALSGCLREGTAQTAPDVTEEMFRWTLLFQTPAARQLAERLSERAHGALGQGRKPPRGRSVTGTRATCASERERLLEHALRLAVTEDYHELSAPQIADAAGVPIDAFFELFDGKQECFLAALDMLGEQLMTLAADPDLRSADWPQAVRRTIGEDVPVGVELW